MKKIFCDECFLQKKVMVFEHKVMGFGNFSAEHFIRQSCFNAKMNKTKAKEQTTQTNSSFII